MSFAREVAVPPADPGTDAGGAGARAERLPYVPALDSMRAVAVIAVLVYHHDPAGVPGGWLGVSLFFTLSGFLIAGLLLVEHENTGRIDLRSFWTRRMRRLLPASVLAVGMAFVVLAASSIHRSDAALTDIRAAILNVANWRFLAADTPYAGAEGAPSPVQHYWSLAIEEQFYLVLPLLAVVALRYRILGWVVGGVVAASLALQLAFDSGVDRIYFGTDTRAAELGVGVALALALPALRGLIGERRWLADAWGFVALVACGVLFLAATLDSDFVGSGALTAVTVVWVGLLVASVCGRTFPTLFGRGPLPAIGRISYGIYLYHWPVFLLLTRTRTGIDGIPLFGARVAVTVVLAAASAALVELPIRRGALFRSRTFPVALAAVVVVVVATTVPFVRTPSTTSVASVVPPRPQADGTAPIVPVSERPATSTTSTSSPPAGNPGSSAAPTTDAPEPTAGPPATTTTTTTAPAPRRVPRLLVVGDSTAGVTGTALQNVASADGVAEVYVFTVPGCAVLPYEVAMVRDGYEFETECDDIFADTEKAAASIDPDAIVFFLGSGQLMDAKYPGLDGFRSVLDAEVATRYRRALQTGMSRLQALGVPVLWADVPLPDWDIDAFGELMGGPLPGSGEATTNDPAGTRRLNELDAGVLGAHPFVARWPFAAALAGPDGVIDPGVRSDGLHLETGYAEELSRSTLLGLLRDAFRHVWAQPGAHLRAGDRTTWSPG